LGEYYLELDELRISEEQGGLIVAARAHDVPLSKLPYSIPVHSTTDMRRALEASGWVVTSPQAGPIPLFQGRRYRIEVRGNNGFGHENATRCTVEVSSATQVRCGLFRRRSDEAAQQGDEADER
jgi:hypothetical protein